MSLGASEFCEAGMSLPPEVRLDALEADPSRAIPAESVRGRFEAKWSARS
jgi:hypothetical protein